MPDNDDIDINAFNTDPKYEKQREKLDAMNAASLERIAAQRAKKKAEEDAKKPKLPFPFNLFQGE